MTASDVKNRVTFLPPKSMYIQCHNWHLHAFTLYMLFIAKAFSLCINQCMLEYIIDKHYRFDFSHLICNTNGILASFCLECL